jgi:hypothetical protein
MQITIALLPAGILLPATTDSFVFTPFPDRRSSNLAVLTHKSKPLDVEPGCEIF